MKNTAFLLLGNNMLKKVLYILYIFLVLTIFVIIGKYIEEIAKHIFGKAAIGILAILFILSLIIEKKIK